MSDADPQADSADKADDAEIEDPRRELAEIVESIPEDVPQKKEIFKWAMQYSGPLPPPRMLAEYESILPGTTERLVSLVENEAKHRHKLADDHQKNDDHVVKHTTYLAYSGLAVAASIALLTIGGGIYLAANGKDLVGLSTILGSLAVLVGVFVTDKVVQAKRESKPE